MEKNETFVSAFDRAFIRFTRLIMLKSLCRFGFQPLVKQTGIELSHTAPFIDACLFLKDEIYEVEQDVRFKFKNAYGEELPVDKLEMIKRIEIVHGPESETIEENKFDFNDRLEEFTAFLRGEDDD